MKKHRVRTGIAFDEKFTFIEVGFGEWLPVEKIPTHEAIHDLIDDEIEKGCWYMRCSTRHIDLCLSDIKEHNLIT